MIRSEAERARQDLVNWLNQRQAQVERESESLQRERLLLFNLRVELGAIRSAPATELLSRRALASAHRN